MTNVELLNRFAQSFLKYIGRMPRFGPPEADHSTFDIRHSLFDTYSPPEEDSIFIRLWRIRFFRVSFVYKSGRSATSGCADT